MRRRTVLGGVGLGLAGIGAVSWPIPPAPTTPDPSKWPDRGLYAAWLGHTTVLLKADGTTIITDPVFSDRIGINLGVATLGLKRLVKPAIPFQKLPKIDLIVLSHAHMDH